MINNLARNLVIAALTLIAGTALVTATPLPMPTNTNVKQSTLNPVIVQAVKNYYVRRGFLHLETFRVWRVIEAGPYAVASWLWGEGGGQAALAQKGGQWTVIFQGGGHIDKGILVDHGVPERYAAAISAKNR